MSTPRKFVADRTCQDSERFARSYKIVEYAHDSVEALYDAFVEMKGGRKGAATDEEQDVLRAMLVSAGAGLDSTLKQLFRDTLRRLIGSDPSVKIGYADFIERELKKGHGEFSVNTKFLAHALAGGTPFMSARYVYDLTGSSLQSVDQLFAASSALGLDPIREMHLDKNQLKEIFDARNKIVHEMDMDFTAPRRNRIQRRVLDMVNKSNVLLEISQRFVEEVLFKLEAPS